MLSSALNSGSTPPKCQILQDTTTTTWKYTDSSPSQPHYNHLWFNIAPKSLGHPFSNPSHHLLTQTLPLFFANPPQKKWKPNFCGTFPTSPNQNVKPLHADNEWLVSKPSFWFNRETTICGWIYKYCFKQAYVHRTPFLNFSNNIPLFLSPSFKSKEENSQIFPLTHSWHGLPVGLPSFWTASQDTFSPHMSWANTLPQADLMMGLLPWTFP